MGGNFFKRFLPNLRGGGVKAFFKKPRLFRAGSGAECVAGIV